jgi:hypothetical protein
MDYVPGRELMSDFAEGTFTSIGEGGPDYVIKGTGERYLRFSHVGGYVSPVNWYAIGADRDSRLDTTPGPDGKPWRTELLSFFAHLRDEHDSALTRWQDSGRDADRQRVAEVGSGVAEVLALMQQDRLDTTDSFNAVRAAYLAFAPTVLEPRPEQNPGDQVILRERAPEPLLADKWSPKGMATDFGRLRTVPPGSLAGRPYVYEPSEATHAVAFTSAPLWASQREEAIANLTKLTAGEPPRDVHQEFRAAGILATLKATDREESSAHHGAILLEGLAYLHDNHAAGIRETDAYRSLRTAYEQHLPTLLEPERPAGSRYSPAFTPDQRLTEAANRAVAETTAASTKINVNRVQPSSGPAAHRPAARRTR